MYNLKILLLASSVILTGCISLEPEYQRPKLNIPVNIEPGVTSLMDENKTVFILPSWTDFIVDPNMQEIIRIALEKNPDLYLTVLDIEEAKIQFGITESELYPKVGISLSSEYSKNLQGESALSKKYNSGIDISYELDFFGKIKNLTQADRAKFLASKELNRAAEIITIKTVAQAYLDIVYNQELLSIAEETKSSYLNSQSIVMQKLIAGSATVSDVEQAKGQIQSVNIKMEKIKVEIDKNKNLLNYLTNNYTENIDVVSVKYTPITIPSNIPSEILLNRPDVMAAEQNIIAENANIGVARAAFFPSISFNTGLSSSNESISGLFDSSNGIWNFIPKITLPIFTGNKNSKNLELANIRKNKSIVNYEKSIQTAFREVKDSMVLKSSIENQIISQQAYVVTLTNILSQKQAGYNYGSLSYLNVLDAQRNLFSEKQNLLMLEIEQQKNEINLFSALGGGNIN
ncbi:efflux transporter outer membrane subunit [Providencia rustigianii]|uniref:efflux transporter outer membrane subunit n=1 Tax=Providencia rustigianii TaxID=158850 RepID=UPI000F6FDBD7|nr:efflux transporter outer membrane subunit [Providencia rustigianii]MTC60263.1 efflux transporter outer membrane subunit [Providencia rustigianii]VEH53965.1 Cation efflux system protein CusC precursor [Providencia rustigianii]